MRYLFKKISGNIFFIPLEKEAYHDPVILTQMCHTLDVPARAFTTFEEAFNETKEYLKEYLKEAQDLLVVCGSKSIIASYWKLKGIKKFM
jgi:hypothetical protein